MIPLTRDDVKPVCGRRGCGHDHGPMYIHARCHIGTPVKVVLDGDILTVSCGACGALVAPFQVATAESAVIENTCHPGVSMACAYEDGAIHLLCERCDTRVLSFPLAERTP